MKLRPYQFEDIGKINFAFSKKHKSVLHVLATGGGKTVEIIEMAARSASKGNIVFVLVHKLEILRKTYQDFRKVGLNVGIIHKDYTANYTLKIQLCMVQSLANVAHKLPIAPDFIIIDEAHHTNANTWSNFILRYPNAWILGVTATPVRTDGKGLGDIFEVMTEGPSMQFLIDNYYLLKPRFICAEMFLDCSNVKVNRDGEFNEDQLAELLAKSTIVGDSIDSYRSFAPYEPGIAFCVNIAEAEKSAKQFNEMGFKAVCITGLNTSAEQTRAFKQLADGSINIITSVALISEGVDIPAVNAIIDLKPKKGIGGWLQEVGRGLRPLYAEGYDLDSLEGRKDAITATNSKAIIIDHVGNVIRHKLPQMPKKWKLEKTENIKKGKKEPIEEEGIDIIQCHACFVINHASSKVCENCGVALKLPNPRIIKKEEGKLVEITEDFFNLGVQTDPIMDKINKINADSERKLKISRARSYDELLQVAKELGYKEGWAKHIFQSRQSKNTSLI